MAAPGSECGGSDGGYRDLRDVRVELDPGTARGGGGGGFAVCFWLYLSSSARPSSVILHQVGWILLSPRGSGDYLAMASAGIVLFSDGYMEGGIACCFCGLFFVSSVLYP